MFTLDKFSLIILTRCDLKCRLCCEYVPQNKPFSDMTVREAEMILQGVFCVADHIRVLHLTGGGEPFLHPKLPELIEAAMAYQEHFDRLMIFTNCTVPLSDALCDQLSKYQEKILVQVSCYGIFPKREAVVLEQLRSTGVALKVEKYYGEDQSFGGWVDFGPWVSQERTPKVLEQIFHDCAVTRDMGGNWRTRDGKVHWCSRSQRGMELGYIPDVPEDYVDLFDGTTVEEKRDKFRRIAATRFITACNYCSGNQGTADPTKRYPAAEQMEAEE